MKESWLFDKLDTLGEDERDIDRREGLEEDVRAMQKMIFGEGSESANNGKDTGGSLGRGAQDPVP